MIVIAIGYGANEGKQHKSKTLEQVIKGKKEKPDWFNYGVGWHFLLLQLSIKFEIWLNDDGTVTFIDKGGPYSKVDIGIVKYHFEVGAEYAKSQGTNI